MIRLYLDEDSMTRGLVQALRANGIDVDTVGERGARGRPDEYQLVAATELQRAVYTKNIGDFT